MEGGDMRSFNVFSNDDGDYKAVKQGWCWPAFFFGSIWALFSGLWLVAFLLLPIDFVFSIAGNSANGALDPYDNYDETTRLVVLAVFSIPLAIRVLVGMFGNSWRMRKLRRLGFSHVVRVKADGKEHAISLCKVEASHSASGCRHAKLVAGGPASLKGQSEIEQIIANANPSLAEDIGRWAGQAVSRLGSAKTVQNAAAGSRFNDTINRRANPEGPASSGEPRSEKANLQGFPPRWLGWSIAALSILAVADMPYGYYQLLRLLAAGYMGYLAALYFIRRPNPWAWAFAFIALLYNPIFVIAMSKEFHALANLIVAAAIVCEMKKLRGVFFASNPTPAAP